jgi:hypothetical protein
MPIPLGVLAVAGAGGGAVAGNAYELLTTTLITSDTADVTFSNLNSTYGSTYQHLQLRITARDTRNFSLNTTQIRFNGDSTGNYSWHRLYGNGSTVTSASQVSGTTMYAVETGANSTTANVFGAAIIDILDPFETTKNTTIRSLTGLNNQTIVLYSGAWRDTSALTSIYLVPEVGASYVSGSRFSLYGMRSS